jgi:hypothetical protein
MTSSESAAIPPPSERDQLRELKARYCRLLDEKQWDEFRELFASDSVLRFFDPAGSVTFSCSYDTLDSLIARLTGSVSVHQVFSSELELTSASTAHGIWAMEDIVFLHPGVAADLPFSSLHGYGHYRETYRKVDGRWRIVTLDLTRIHRETGKEQNASGVREARLDRT